MSIHQIISIEKTEAGYISTINQGFKRSSKWRTNWFPLWRFALLTATKPKLHRHQPRPSTWWDNHHHLSSTGNILPCWFRNLNWNHLCLPLRFQHHPQLTHDVYTHHMNSTCTLSILSHKNISRQYCRGQKGHLLICIRYSTFSLTMKCFRKSLTSMCFGISCCHKCTAYEIWWTCRKDGRLIAYRIWKETFLHRYRCLSHLTFPIHLSVATTNTAFVYVFSPLESLMWSGYCSQGWWKRNLADPWHSPIKQTKFRLHVFFIRSSSIKDSTEFCGKNKKQQY